MTVPDNRPDRALARRIKQHLVAREHRFFAVVQPGFEETARAELEEIGISPPFELSEGGVEFTARLEGCYRVNLCSRTVTRVLMRVAGFRADNFKSLERHTLDIPWELYLYKDAPVNFNVSCRHSRLYHSGAVEERARKAVAERLSHNGADRGDTVRGRASPVGQAVFVRLEDDVCALSLDASGAPLYRRGYKTRVTEAPLRETLAAAILREAKLEKYDTLLDLMGGSGTFSLEGAMMFQGRRPGLDRSFVFTGWPAFREAAFNHLLKRLRAEEQAKAMTGKTVIYRDMDTRAAGAARFNFSSAGLEGVIRAEEGDFLADPVPIPPGRAFIALNPPWGARLGGPEEARRLYRKIGETVRKHYAGCGYGIIVPGLDLEKVLGLPYDRKILFMSGGVKVGVLIRDG